MDGYQITFITHQHKRHNGKPMGDWLTCLAKEIGLCSATLVAGGEGFGRRRIHSVYFFELADRPVEVIVASTAEDTDRLFDRLKMEGVHLFYVKSSVEFGVLGKSDL